MNTKPLIPSTIGIVAVIAATFVVSQQRRLAQSQAEIDRLRSETARCAKCGKNWDVCKKWKLTKTN